MKCDTNWVLKLHRHITWMGWNGRHGSQGSLHCIVHHLFSLSSLIQEKLINFLHSYLLSDWEKLVVVQLLKVFIFSAFTIHI